MERSPCPTDRDWASSTTGSSSTTRRSAAERTNNAAGGIITPAGEVLGYGTFDVGGLVRTRRDRSCGTGWSLGVGSRLYRPHPPAARNHRLSRSLFRRPLAAA